jgi:hypothetical protein
MCGTVDPNPRYRLFLFLFNIPNRCLRKKAVHNPAIASHAALALSAAVVTASSPGNNTNSGWVARCVWIYAIFKVRFFRHFVCSRIKL